MSLDAASPGRGLQAEAMRIACAILGQEEHTENLSLEIPPLSITVVDSQAVRNICNSVLS